MAMQALPQKSEVQVLRIARVAKGRIEEERLVSDALRVGPGERAHFVVPGLGGMKTVFECKGGQWTLNVPAGCDEVRLANGAEVGSATGTTRLVESARGRLRFGEVSLLFQLVAPPPKMAKPMLPSSVRGGLFGQVDWAFTSIASAIFTFFFAGLVFLEGADWPVAMGLEDNSYAMTLILEEPQEPPAATQWQDHEPEPELTRDNGPAPDVAPNDPPPTTDRTPRRADRPSTPQQTSDAPPSLDYESIAQQVAQALVIGTNGESGGMTSFNELIEGADTTGAGDILAQVTGVDDQRVARSDRVLVRDTPGSGEGMDLGMLARRNQPRTEMEGSDVTERDLPPSRLDYDEPIDVDGAEFDARLLAQRVRRLSSRIARCYELELSRNPTARGRVGLQLTVFEPGHVRARVTSSQLTSATGACIVRHLNTIRFRDGGPEGGNAVFEWPLVFSPQQ